MMASTAIYGCGCTLQVTVADSMNRLLVSLEGQPTGEGVFAIELIRISPTVFLETNAVRPEWAKDHHSLVSFDITKFADANVAEFDRLFAPYREKFGPVVPQCWLPELLAGRGRFFGLWQRQRIESRKYEHLRVVDNTEEVEVSHDSH